MADEVDVSFGMEGSAVLYSTPNGATSPLAGGRPARYFKTTRRSASSDGRESGCSRSHEVGTARDSPT